ncbi:MAG: phosphatase PAP2 family protein, partial [Candidatus Eisenbacteria bacterium]
MKRFSCVRGRRAVALTTFVCIERVRAGAHFPSDVISGAIAGAGVGVIVPHLHRSADVKQRDPEHSRPGKSFGKAAGRLARCRAIVAHGRGHVGVAGRSPRWQD